MSTFLVPEESAFKNVTILITILTQTMTKTLLELSLEEKLIVAKKFAISMKTVVLPLSLISEVAIELVRTNT
jgi:hypothetical protein